MTDIEIYRGDNKTWEITVKDVSGEVVDITGAEIIMSVKKNVSDVSYLIQRKNLAAGGDSGQIEIIDAENGVFNLHLVPENTNNLRPSKYTYDIQATISGKVYTILFGGFGVLGDITR